MPIAVEIEANCLRTGACLPLELEGAAYFFVSEGLANVLKYPAATRVRVRFHSGGRRLVIEVADDGRGFEPSLVKLSGLRGLQDRVEALDGRMQVASSPGHGTHLRAELPLTEETS